MKLYLISQNENSGWDTYDSAVVAAENESEARIINPGGYREWDREREQFHWIDSVPPSYDDRDSSWTRPENVEVEYLGEAAALVGKGVIMTSFNAG